MKYTFFSIYFILAFGNLNGITIIDQNITSPETWTVSQSPYKITKNIEISSALQIEKGVTIRLERSVSIVVSGRLTAIGTADSLISFIPHINNNKNEHWGKLIFSGSPFNTPSFLSYCLFEGGGFAGSTPIEIRTTHTPDFLNITMRNNKKNAIEVHPDAVRYGITLKKTGIPYTFQDNCHLEQGYDLIIEPGVVLKLPGSWFMRVRGNVIARGTIDEPIILTSLFDDAADNIDTDNLGFTTGSPGDWGGFILEGSVDHGKTIFRNCIFRYGGGSMMAKQSYLFFYNSMCAIDYCTFEHSAGHAISTFANAMPDIGGGHLRSHGQNTFSGFLSPKYAISNQSAYEIPAKFNCWGTNEPNLIKLMYHELPGKVDIEPYLNNCNAMPPLAVLLSEPVNNSIGNNLELQLRWNSTMFADSYTVQISTNPNFIESDTYKLSSQDTLFNASNLQISTKYYWRVLAENIVGKANWSDIWSFRTVDVAPPASPTAIFPIDYTFSLCGAHFRWNYPPASINAFHLQVAEDINFNKLIFDNMDLQDTTHSISNLESGSKFYWRVRAKNDIAWSSWSDINSFNSREKYLVEHFAMTNDKVRKAFSADVNGDGFFDVVLETDAGVFLYRNISNNHFNAYPINNFKEIIKLEFADFDNNNWLDVAILGINQSDERVFKIFRYDGTALVDYYTMAKSESRNAAFFAVGDLFGNGFNDIAVTFSDNSKLTIYKNNDGTILKHKEIEYHGSEYVIIKDFDNNGKNEILLSKSNDNPNDKSLLLHSLELASNDIFVEREIGKIAAYGDNPSSLIKSNFFDISGRGYYSIFDFSAIDSLKIAVYSDNQFISDKKIESISPNPINRYDNYFSDPSFGMFIDLNYDGINDLVLQDGNTLKIINTKNHFDANDLNILADSIANFKFQSLYTAYETVHLLGIRNDSLFIVRNQNCFVNEKLPAPIPIHSNISGKDIILEWEMTIADFNDSRRDENNFSLSGTRSFNVKVGTYPGGNDVVMPACDPISGKPFLLEEGNAGYKWQFLLKDLAVGKYYWSVQTIDAAYRYSDFSKEMSFEVLDSYNMNDIFTSDKPISGAKTRFFLRDNQLPKYNNETIPISSVIACFIKTDSSIIPGGYHKIDSNTPTRLTIWSNIADNESFDLNDIVFVLWNAADKTLNHVSAVYDFDATKNYSASALFAEIYISEFIEIGTHQLHLKENCWHLVSSYLNPIINDLDSIFFDKNHIIMDSEGNRYKFAGDKDIEKWSKHSAFWVYSGSNDTINIYGNGYSPSAKQFVLNKGWHILPYPYIDEMPIDSVLSGLTNIAVAVNSYGEVFYPDKSINNIKNISAGEALKVYIEQDGTNFAFKDGISFDKSTEVSSRCNYFQDNFNSTGNEMYIIFESDFAKDSDEIAAFDIDGNILGASVFNSKKSSLTIRGNNLLTENIDGALEGYPIIFKYYSNIDSKEYSLYIDTIQTLISMSDTIRYFAAYRRDVVAYRHLTLSDITSVADNGKTSDIFVYPNPAKDILNISQFEEHCTEYNIFNIYGELLQQGQSGRQIDISQLPSGVHFIDICGKKYRFVKI